MTAEQTYGKPTTRARLFSFTALSLIATAIGWAGMQAYRAATDSFVAPLILSPDSDAVLATKLHASQLEAERVKTASEIERIDADISAGVDAISRLRALTAAQRDPREWFARVQRNAESAGTSELAALSQQRAHLQQMIGEQEVLVREAKANAAAHIIPRSDFTREVLALSQLKLALFDTERARVRGELEVTQGRLTRSALDGRGPTMPELVAREEQMARIELELMKLEAEQRTKRSERTTLAEKVTRIEELEAQLRARPIYRAAQGRVEASFVPYTQMKGVERGAVVYDCVWGLFRCKAVGTVAELVPGEVVLPDPWGSQARGQYAILDLRDHDAARAKILRVRPPAGLAKAPPSDGPAVTSR